MITNVYIPAGGAGVLSTFVYCALKECLESKPDLLPCKVTLRYRPVEYTGYGLDVPQKVPRRREVLYNNNNSINVNSNNLSCMVKPNI